MKKAFGVLELLIVVIIVIVVYFTCFKSNYGRSNPFDDNAKDKTQSQMVDDKIQEIEDTKALKEKIEHNWKEDY